MPRSAVVAKLVHDDTTIIGRSRAMLNDALRAQGEPIAVVLLVFDGEGGFSLRTVSGRLVKDFDMYSRAAVILAEEARRLVD